MRNPKGYERKTVRKGKTNTVQAWTGPEGSRNLRLPEFLDIRHMKVVRLSALRTGHFNPTKKYTWYSFLLEADSTGRIMSKKNLNDTIGKLTRDLPAQPTAPQRAPMEGKSSNLIWGILLEFFWRR
jgi:hypothetical protein